MGTVASIVGTESNPQQLLAQQEERYDREQRSNRKVDRIVEGLERRIHWQIRWMMVGFVVAITCFCMLLQPRLLPFGITPTMALPWLCGMLGASVIFGLEHLYRAWCLTKKKDKYEGAKTR